MKYAKTVLAYKTRMRRSQQGFSLLEMAVALGILLIVAVSTMSLGALALATTENQGHLQARTAEYAQDKMEQLLALSFCDGQTDTTVYPAVGTGGTGLAGCTNNPNPNIPPTPLAGGGLSFNAPVGRYVDYVDSNGNPTSTSGNWQYMRVWQISLPAGTTLIKQISVACEVRSSVAGQGQFPQTTVIALKSYPF